jgi:hypothetical protein
VTLDSGAGMFAEVVDVVIDCGSKGVEQVAAEVGALARTPA